MRPDGRYFVLAETKGFEPSRAFRPYLVSSEALSTTQPRLRIHFNAAVEVEQVRPPPFGRIERATGTFYPLPTDLSLDIVCSFAIAQDWMKRKIFCVS